MKIPSRFILALGLGCLSPLLWASDVPGSSDLPDVPRLADAQIVDYSVRPDVERIYPMGSIRKISGRLRFEGQVNARGQITAVTYELPAEHSATEAFTAAREALQKQGAELLFWCQARDCGESSLWANEVFGNSKLVGSDEQQSYLLLRRAAPLRTSWLPCTGSIGAIARPICTLSRCRRVPTWENCCLPRPPCNASLKARASWIFPSLRATRTLSG